MKPKFVICGVEHSGTTLLSDIFRQVPGLDSGFEVGVLLSDSPKEFRNNKPFILNIVDGWGIKESDLNTICDTNSFEEFYRRLYNASTVINKPCEIFDKTPRYYSKLSYCMRQFDGQFIAVYKDPRAIVCSDFKRSKQKIFEKWYPEYKNKKISYLQSIYKNYLQNSYELNDKVLSVSLEDICLDARNTIEKLFSHVSIGFDLDYFLLKNLRYKNTRVNYISTNIAFEYKNIFNREQQEIIKTDFIELEDWFYQ